MTKKLFTQIKNEWRSNTWLALELLVVSVVMWYIVDYIYTQAATAMEPRGFDIEHCYLINMGRLTDKSPDYIPPVCRRTTGGYTGNARSFETPSGRGGCESFAEFLSLQWE